jgi:16S rRNA (adenine1518-N6/adenine1519-N6)-dimethyltransferase
MLRASLRPLGGEALLDAAGIDPRRRAETLNVAEFEKLALATIVTTAEPNAATQV